MTQEFAVSDDGKKVIRSIRVAGECITSAIPVRSRPGLDSPVALDDPRIAWIQSYLAGGKISTDRKRARLLAADLFCGAGGLSQGVKDAAKLLGYELEIALAVDANQDALEMYKRNHFPYAPVVGSVQTLVNYQISGQGADARWSVPPTLIEPNPLHVDEIDVLLAGPPCQGHSNLNNRTRRNDKRNLLYLTAPAMAVALKAAVCIIENVPEVLSDSHKVVDTARALFIKSGYTIDEAIFSATDFGVAQTRKRHFLVAVRDERIEFDLESLADKFRLPTTTVKHVIGDLEESAGDDAFHSSAVLSAENRRRIDVLFDREIYELPDEERPVCHQGGHTYPSVYGRMKWDVPSQTITTGFLTPGRGRYIHPSKRRTLTPHEAARIQSFPDGYAFDLAPQVTPRTAMAQVIGDAVPPLLGQGVGLAALSLLKGIR